MRAIGAGRHTKVPAGLGHIMKVECSLTVTGTVTADVSTTTTNGTATDGTAISAVIMIGMIIGAGINHPSWGRALRPARGQCPVVRYRGLNQGGESSLPTKSYLSDNGAGLDGISGLSFDKHI